MLLRKEALILSQNENTVLLPTLSDEEQRELDEEWEERKKRINGKLRSLKENMKVKGYYTTLPDETVTDKLRRRFYQVFYYPR